MDRKTELRVRLNELCQKIADHGTLYQRTAYEASARAIRTGKKEDMDSARCAVAKDDAHQDCARTVIALVQAAWPKE